MIYTSYYTKMSRLSAEDKIFLRVSNSQPSWFKHKTIPCTKFYPEWLLVEGVKNKTITEDEYKQAYLLMLNKDPEFKSKMQDKLKTLQKDNPDKNIVLLCWEAPDKFCHRHILADWLDMGIYEYIDKQEEIWIEQNEKIDLEK